MRFRLILPALLLCLLSIDDAVAENHACGANRIPTFERRLANAKTEAKARTRLSNLVAEMKVTGCNVKRKVPYQVTVSPTGGTDVTASADIPLCCLPTALGSSSPRLKDASRGEFSPVSYAYDPRLIRGGEPVPSLRGRIEISNAAGAKVYTLSEFKKLNTRVSPVLPIGAAHITQPKGAKGKVIGFGEAQTTGNYSIRGYLVDFDPPGFNAGKDGYIWISDADSVYGGGHWQSYGESKKLTYKAKLKIVDAPLQLQPGEVRRINVKVTNTGSQTLVAGNSYSPNYSLRVDQDVARSVDWQEYQFPYKTGNLTSDLAKKAETTIPFTITAPTTGRYVLRLRLLRTSFDPTNGKVTREYIGKTQDVVITVGSPSLASLKCPEGLEVVDRNDFTVVPHSPPGGTNYLFDAGTIGRGEVRSFCVVLDQTPLGGSATVYARDNTDDDTRNYYSIRVVPPAGSGMRVFDSLKEGQNSAQYDYARYTGLNQPVAGNYLVTVTGGNIDSPRTLYVGGQVSAETVFASTMPKLGNITGRTVDSKGASVGSVVAISEYEYANGGPNRLAYSTFVTGSDTSYNYNFPNIVGGSDDYYLGGGAPRQFKISSFKPGHYSEYRVNGGAWVKNSWVRVTLPAGGTTIVDWRYTLGR